MAELVEFTNITSEPTPWIEVRDPAALNKIPLVSVLLITYNHAPYIAQAIEGALNQVTTFPIELVIGEDNSTDGTREIVLDYQKRYPNAIRIITSNNNVGAHINAERTRKSCRGKYIACCEGDDYWIDTLKLQKQVDQIEANPEMVMSAHRAYTVDVHGNIIDIFPSIQQKYLKPRDVVIRFGGFFATNSIMVKNELFMNIPSWFYDFPVGDSALMNLGVQRGKIGFINDIMSAYRKGVEESWTFQQDISWRKKYNHLINSDKAYCNLIYIEKKYVFYYYIKRIRILLELIDLLACTFIIKPVKSMLTFFKKNPPSPDL